MKQDVYSARKNFEKAVAQLSKNEKNPPQGVVDVIFGLATLYSEGLGVEPNLHRAVELTSLAAKYGHPIATCALGTYCQHGEGMPKDAKRAYQLYFDSAAKGNSAAC